MFFCPPPISIHQHRHSNTASTKPVVTPPLFPPNTSIPSSSSSSSSPPSKTQTPPPPSSSSSSSSSTSSTRRPHRKHRCSRCGQEGHNVRLCPHLREDIQWYDQRCGRCGLQGHNARNCTGQSSTICRVCRGAGRLPCSKCTANLTNNNSITSNVSPERRAVYARRARLTVANGFLDEVAGARLIISSPLTAEQRRMADVIRRRVRRQAKQDENLNDNENEDEELVGGDKVWLRTTGPVISATSRTGRKPPTTVLTKKKVVARSKTVDLHHEGNGERLGNLRDNEPEQCARCMGTGYLTCMACN